MNKIFKAHTVLLNVHDKQIPLKIMHECRTDARVSMGKTDIHLRLPAIITQKQFDEYLVWAKKWAEEQFDKHDHLKTQYVGKTYRSGDILKVGKHEYVLNIVFENRKTHYVKLVDTTINLSLAFDDTDAHLQKSIKLLISRMVASHQLAAVHKRVWELNIKHFQKNIHSIKLKHNESNWGSCSSTGNLNLSTRLLLLHRRCKIM
jgi:predicted metal-dependent hydrolase